MSVMTKTMDEIFAMSRSELLGMIADEARAEGLTYADARVAAGHLEAREILTIDSSSFHAWKALCDLEDELLGVYEEAAWEGDDTYARTCQQRAMFPRISPLWGVAGLTDDDLLEAASGHADAQGTLTSRTRRLCAYE